MDVCFYANLRQIAGTKRVAFDLASDITVKDVLRAAERRFPALSPLLWAPDGSLSDYESASLPDQDTGDITSLCVTKPDGGPWNKGNDGDVRAESTAGSEIPHFVKVTCPMAPVSRAR